MRVGPKAETSALSTPVVRASGNVTKVSIAVVKAAAPIAAMILLADMNLSV